MTTLHDDHHGHVTVEAGDLLVVIADMGDHCRVERKPDWEPLSLTEDQAREVGSALIAWAGRKRLARRKAGGAS